MEIHQPQFSPRSSEVIAKAINGNVVIVNSLKKDIIENLNLITNSILKGIKQ